MKRIVAFTLLICLAAQAMDKRTLLEKWNTSHSKCITFRTLTNFEINNMYFTPDNKYLIMKAQKTKLRKKSYQLDLKIPWHHSILNNILERNFTHFDEYDSEYYMNDENSNTYSNYSLAYDGSWGVFAFRTKKNDKRHTLFCTDCAVEELALKYTDDHEGEYYVLFEEKSICLHDPYTYTISSVKLSKNGKYFAVAYTNNQIKLFALTKEKIFDADQAQEEIMSDTLKNLNVSNDTN